MKYHIHGTYSIELWGAGNDKVKGAYTSGKIHLAKGTILYFYLGQEGIQGGTSATFNGGGSATFGEYSSFGSQYIQNYPGAGATDVRLYSNGTWNDFTSLNSRIMVAGGGAYNGAGGGI